MADGQGDEVLVDVGGRTLRISNLDKVMYPTSGTTMHKTGFRYASPVRASYNEARMTPSVNDTQTVWSSRLSIEPAAWSINYTDYWGTAVTTFEVHERHSRLTVRSQAVVETRGDGLPWDTDRRVPTSDLGWAALQDRGVTDSMSEFLTVNERTTAPDELLELAQGVSSQAPRLAGLDVCRLVADRLSYRRGSTEVTSTAREVWAGGTGVCQDYSHVALGALRSIGLPARYVSGYLFPSEGTTRTRPSRASRTRGWSGGAAAGWATTRPSGSGCPSTTCGSATVATTATSPRCAAPTPAAPRTCSSPWR